MIVRIRRFHRERLKRRIGTLKRELELSNEKLRIAQEENEYMAYRLALYRVQAETEITKAQQERARLIPRPAAPAEAEVAVPKSP
jgi:hypothetical protein